MDSSPPPTAPRSDTSSGPASASQSRSAGGWVATVTGAVISLYAMTLISKAWMAHEIPDWRWALAAMLAAAMPGDAMRLAARVLKKKE